MTSATHAVVRIERTIPATPAQVYRAWLDPGLVGRWMAPGAMDVTGTEIDARPGGRYRIWQSLGGVPHGGFDGEVVELVPDERLSFRWGFVGPDRDAGPRFDSLLTVTLRPAPAGGTVLTLVHERLEDLAAAMPGVAANVQAGWEDVVAKLAAILA
jgi:uncharacterized protein YndB with AHSA1/START domain